MNGAGGTGAGWKYGYHVLLENYATISHFSTHRFCLYSDGTLNAEPVTVVVLFEPKGAYSTFDPIVWQYVLFSALLNHLI